MFVAFSGSLECSKPLDILSHKLGLHKVSDKGKECHTVFERLSYNGKTSVVKAMPSTGRTHQIRVHLQYLGESLYVSSTNTFPCYDNSWYDRPLGANIGTVASFEPVNKTSS